MALSRTPRSYFAVVLFISCILGWSCGKKSEQGDRNLPSQAVLLHDCNKKLTDVIISDIFSPPVASRIYAYTNVAAYEALVPAFPEYQSLVSQLNGLTSLPSSTASESLQREVVMLVAFCTTAKKLVYSEYLLEDFQKEKLEAIRKSRTSDDAIQKSVAFGQKIAQAILLWAGKDGFKESRSMPRFTYPKDPAKWVPTPPNYETAVEPYWNTLRPFVMSAANAFAPPPPPAFDAKKNSTFYTEANEVYTIGKNLTEEEKNIAVFWDDNPNVSVVQGHLMYSAKKMTPGGHWIAIARTVLKQKNADLIKSAETYMATAVCLADGFISCWDEKYRSVLLRPETYINTYIDPKWQPFIQTPPFPEYTSGHSTISASAASALTHLWGDNFAFTDSTELEFSLPVRSFTSFHQASREAGLSRMYGGIHYRSGFEAGLEQGKKVGSFIMNKLKTRVGK